jgi:hypothetical protein
MKEWMATGLLRKRKALRSGLCATLYPVSAFIRLGDAEDKAVCVPRCE